MNFLIITHVLHTENEKQYFGYAPYVREMNIWLKHVNKVVVVAPLVATKPTAIDLAYSHEAIDFRAVPAFALTSVRSIFKTVVLLPVLFWRIFSAMQQADHIHLRCPGNMGLLGCFVQLLFPHKKKTAKYAGNWDPKSKQPWSYRLQKWLLSNSFLTRNMQVLVYGDWPTPSRNIVPFFTASYSESEKEALLEHRLQDSEIRMVFAGSLVEGKNPMYAIELVQQLRKRGHQVVLDLFGDGKLADHLRQYVSENQMQAFVFLHGNQSGEVLKKAYQTSHFVILPSKSEGWPKVVAEGMFWGCVPLASAVSCVPYMIGTGERGLLLTMNLAKDVQHLHELLIHTDALQNKRVAGAQWSRRYTLETFEAAILPLL